VCVCVCVCVYVSFVKLASVMGIVFSGNLPQCCMLIELLYCGLIFLFYLIFTSYTKYIKVEE